MTHREHNAACRQIEVSETYTAAFLEHLLRTADLKLGSLDLDEDADLATLLVEEDDVLFKVTVEVVGFAE